MSVSHRIKRIESKLAEPGALGMLFQGVVFAPRLLVHVASIAALAGLFSACVPATRYEEAKSATEVQQALRTRAEIELAVTRSKLDAAMAELDQRDRRLSASEQSASESKLESTLLLKERDEAKALVDQLRSELARVADNLHSYARQEADLEKSLQAAEALKLEPEQNEARTVAIALLTRDLASALGGRVSRGEIVIDVRNGHVLLGALPELWFNDDASVRSAFDDVLTSLGRVLAQHADSAVELSLPSADADKRALALTNALSSRGVSATRIKLRATAGPADTENKSTLARAAVELSISAG